MKFSWGSLGLFYLVAVAWGQFNPQPLSQRNGQSPNAILPRSLSPRTIQDAYTKALQIVARRKNTIGGRRRNPSAMAPVHVARHQSFQKAGIRSLVLHDMQEKFEETTRVLTTEYNLTPEQVEFGLARADLKTIVQGNGVQNCAAQFNVSNCKQSKRFRTFDGTCNNRRHPSWGMASSCFQRLVDPDYADGTAKKRVALSGNPLPSPRRISLEIHSHFDSPIKDVNHMFMVWGQFLDHDIALTPLSRGPNNELLACCPAMDDDPENCDPILLEQNDPFFSTMNIDCLSNARSAICSTCSLGPRQHTNQVTSYIDASQIYGLNANESRVHRNNDGSGTLRSVTVNGAGELPPGSPIPNEDQCSLQDPNRDCFQTGDQRANQHPALTSMHIIFLREHNRIARALRQINPRWDDERLFQETRRIIGAEMQMITYNEYLPLVLGPERMEWFDLNVRRKNQFTEYDETVQATLVHEFSTAAYRFGHSMINSFFQGVGGNNSGILLRNIFNIPFGLYNGEMEGIVQGLTASPSQKFDRSMVQDVTNHLYQVRGTNGSGLDLAALNVNRGRDHGIPGYTTLLKFCGGPTITSWKQLDLLFQKGVRQMFEKLYERVEDIDLFSGGLAEKSYQGAVVGPTFMCIMGIQFYHLKYGDRFYFEHGRQAGSFTPAQLAEIKKIIFSKIICDNSNIAELPDNAFLLKGTRNRAKKCQDKPGMNLNAWKE